MKTLYLAGAINGCNDQDATGWRQTAMHELDGLYHFLDPMVRDYRGVEDENVEAIVQGDLVDINASDIILVAANRPSWGTGMETFYAATQTPAYIIVVCDGRVSPWLRHHSDQVVSTLDEAVALLREIA